MAGDGVRMREDLFSYPKFLRLAGLLWRDEGRRQASYVTGRNGASREVTTCNEVALRDVTFASLFRVWCAVNAHCKVVGTDAVCPGMALTDLDALAGYEGFGGAMATAGLAVAHPDGCLIFPNFLEFNEPACLRAAPLTPRERAARCRAKKRQQAAASAPVTERNGASRDVTERNGASLHHETPHIHIEEEKKTTKTNSKSKWTPPFAPPTIDEVAAYCRERGNGVDPERFVSHYESNGWRVGRNPMRDWRAAVRTWEKNAGQYDARPRSQSGSSSSDHLFDGVRAFLQAGRNGEGADHDEG